MPNKTWLVEPRDSLIIRDARPSLSGEPMRTLPYPWPSSIAGLARTRAGQDQDGLFALSADEAKKLFAVEVAGPWLAVLDDDDNMKDLAFAAPLDCLWHEAEGQAEKKADDDEKIIERRRLMPVLDNEERVNGVISNKADGMRWILPKQAAPQRKPASAPVFWPWEKLEGWLTKPSNEVDQGTLSDFGFGAFTVEERTQVAIDPETGRPSDGQLFSVEGLRLRDGDNRFGLAFACDDERINAGPVHLGGERRISWLSQLENGRPELPKNFDSSGRLYRLILVTPAIFKDGWKPKKDSVPGAKLVAAVTGRPQSISGWDFANRGPKMTRRMVPAGSVFWFELEEGVDAQKWVEERWMQSICDNQDRRDGFALCLVGVA